MKHSIVACLISGLTFIYVGCTDENLQSPGSTDLSPSGQERTASVTLLDNGVKTEPHLSGTMALNFTGNVGPVNPIWVGTIDIEGYGVFGMRFFHLSPLKAFSQASPFEENFEIYDLDDPTVVLLAGPDVGVTTLANRPPDPCKYRMNGSVDVANGQFAVWKGRDVHMSGIITWQFITLPDGSVKGPVPETAPGTFQVN